MKTKKLFLGLFAVAAIMFISSCEQNDIPDDNNDYGILPERFKVDVPNSLSNEQLKSATLKSAEGDTLSGNEIYEHLNFFIAVGEGAADLVEAIIRGIRIHNINRIISLTYVSEDDNRTKNLVVESAADFKGEVWDYMLTITDADSKTNTDGGIGMQVFWNEDPIKGIAILKPYNIDRVENANAGDAMFSIEYSEAGTDSYDAYMIVEISDFPMPEAEPFAINSMKMFVGKKGDIIDVYGNSNHPNAQFNSYSEEPTGFNWAFVASGHDDKDIAVAEVGLPASTADISGRKAILEDNSIKNVLSAEITNYVVAYYAELEITLNPTEVAIYIAPYLQNAEAPGYFDSEGFIQGGTAPNSDYTDYELRIKSLTPYNPSVINQLSISFKN